MTVLEILTARAPSVLTNPRLDSLITLAQSQLSECILGSDYNYGISLLVLHYLTKEEMFSGSGSNGGVGGTVISKTEGRLSISFSNQNSNLSNQYSDYSKTSWGIELIQLLNSNIMPFTTKMIPKVCR